MHWMVLLSIKGTHSSKGLNHNTGWHYSQDVRFRPFDALVVTHVIQRIVKHTHHMLPSLS
jgi:hypothetical protein